jgi:hypothetical protein
MDKHLPISQLTAALPHPGLLVVPLLFLRHIRQAGGAVVALVRKVTVVRGCPFCKRCKRNHRRRVGRRKHVTHGSLVAAAQMLFETKKQLTSSPKALAPVLVSHGGAVSQHPCEIGL